MVNRVSGQSTPTQPRHRHWYASSLAIRMLIALAIAWMVVMAFFATSVISH